MRRVVFEGNAFYEVDEECEKKKKTPNKCNEKNLPKSKKNSSSIARDNKLG